MDTFKNADVIVNGICMLLHIIGCVLFIHEHADTRDYKPITIKLILSIFHGLMVRDNKLDPNEFII